MTTLLFDARLVLSKPTGIGQYVASLLPELLHQRPDWQIHLLRRPDPWPGYGLGALVAPNLTHHQSREPHMSLRQQGWLPRMARSLGADLLHYPHFDAPVWLGSVPVVATLYDAKFLLRPDFFRQLSWAKRGWMRLCFAATLRRAAATLTISEATATDLQRLFRVPSGRLHVAPLAADASFQPVGETEQRAFRRRYGLERPFVLSVGEFRPHKNHRTLLAAFARSAARHGHELLLVGQPHGEEGALAAQAEALGLAGRVHLRSDVTHEALRAAYSSAACFVLPSLYEGFGLPVLEAMACGCPVIASRTTALGEVVGEGGIQVEPTDPDAIARALDALLSDAAMRAAWVERGGAWQRRYRWAETARRTVAAYEQALR